MKIFLTCLGIIVSFLFALSTSVAFAAGIVFHKAYEMEIIFPVITILLVVALFFCVRWGARKNSLAVGLVLVGLGLFSMYGGFNSLGKLSASYTNHSDAYLASIARERAAVLSEGLTIVGGKIAVPPTLLEDYQNLMVVDLLISTAFSVAALISGILILRRYSREKKIDHTAGASAG